MPSAVRWSRSSGCTSVSTVGWIWPRSNPAHVEADAQRRHRRDQRSGAATDPDIAGADVEGAEVEAARFQFLRRPAPVQHRVADLDPHAGFGVVQRLLDPGRQEIDLHGAGGKPPEEQRGQHDQPDQNGADRFDDQKTGEFSRFPDHAGVSSSSIVGMGGTVDLRPIGAQSQAPLSQVARADRVHSPCSRPVFPHNAAEAGRSRPPSRSGWSAGPSRPPAARTRMPPPSRANMSRTRRAARCWKRCSAIRPS